MGRRGSDTRVNPSEKTIPFVAERTFVAPFFDDKSIQRAQPAIPLRRRAAGRLRAAALVILCVTASLVGGILGGVIISLYLKNSPPAPLVGARLGQPAAALLEAAPGAPTPAPSAPDESVSPAESARPPHAEQPRAATPEETGRPKGTAPAREGVAPAARAESDGAGREAAGRERATEDHAALRGALGQWVAATNRRDIGKQMSFYNPTVNAFYLTRNASREAVRAEKARVFGGADLIEVSAGTPVIRVSPDGRTATMRFRKKYAIGGGGGQDRRGEVLQELRWRRTPQGWKIVSERDLRVMQE